MSKIAIIGDRDSIYAFSTAGIDPFSITEASDAIKLIPQLVDQDYSIIYVIENLYLKIEAYVKTFDELIIPTIIPLPGISGNQGIGLKNVKMFVERAVGADILFADK